MSNYFTKMIDESRRKKVIEQIKENSEPGISFYLMTGISAIIVALGLVTDNTAVVIGAMLIAPIFWPIVAIALAIIRGSANSFKKNLLVLFKALGASVVLILIFTLIYPLKEEPGIEVLSRTTPQLFDLMIALFSGLAGAFAIVWPRVSSSLAGILIATALMPAIGVMGYGISTWDMKIFSGAFLLFATNLIAIIFSAMLTFFFFGFRPIATKKAKEFLGKEVTWTLVLLLVITIPLTYTLYNAVIESENRQTIREVLLTDIPDLTESDIDSINISREKNYLDVETTLNSKYDLTDFEATNIATDIETKIDKSIKLQLNLIPINEVNSQ